MKIKWQWNKVMEEWLGEEWFERLRFRWLVDVMSNARKLEIHNWLIVEKQGCMGVEPQRELNPDTATDDNEKKDYLFKCADCYYHLTVKKTTFVSAEAFQYSAQCVVI